MLVLQIKPGGKFTVGNATIVNLSDRNMKVGIDAPREVPIHRDTTRNKFKAIKAA